MVDVSDILLEVLQHSIMQVQECLDFPAKVNSDPKQTLMRLEEYPEVDHAHLRCFDTVSNRMPIKLHHRIVGTVALYHFSLVLARSCFSI